MHDVIDKFFDEIKLQGLNLKNIEDEEIKLLKLQKQYRNGEIKEEELTEEQVNSLCALYDKQISQLRKSNAILKNNLIKRKIINISLWC